jgi:hypothetical protein
MREFSDAEGRRWGASVREETGPDYKGKFVLVLEPMDAQAAAMELADVRWNSERTAQRTISTMSTVELRRRLRQALGRSLERTAG